MIGALTALLGCQLAGETLVRLIGAPLPGPVVGMLLLFLLLTVRGTAPVPLQDTAHGLLQHLSLLFIPAGTGIMLYGERLKAEGLPITVALIGSTALTILVTATVFRWLARPEPPASTPRDPPPAAIDDRGDRP